VVAVADADDVEALVLTEKTGQPEGEKLFGRHHHHGDPRTGERRAARSAARFERLVEVAVVHVCWSPGTERDEAASPDRLTWLSPDGLRI
jgi:hypothetical protein